MQRFVNSNEMSVEQFKQKRKELGLTQKELAELIGVSKPTVERWEMQSNPISGPVVLALELLTPSYIELITAPDKELPLRFLYMYKNEPCTLIDADEKNQIVRIKNYKTSNQFRAFGQNTSPTYQDFQEFLESRCFPKSRDRMKLVLQDLNLPFYDPMMIIEKTQWRMVEDDFWIKVEK